MARLPRLLLLVLLGMHLVLLAAYTGPARWVPPVLRAWSMAYVRPLFHQGWDLFAPDPPRCSCTLHAKVGDGPWRALGAEGKGPMGRRLARHLAAYLGGGAPLPDTLLIAPRWIPALRALTPGDGPAADTATYRAVQRCAEGPTGSFRVAERVVPVTLIEP